MRASKIVTAAVMALALTLAPFAGAVADAATPGYHAAYFSESAFLTLTPGATGQFSVGYTNTGDQPWVKGTSGKQASLHTAAPLDNPIDYTAGWAVNWTAPNIYAVQANDLVAPGQIGFFTYSVKVPATQAFGPKSFYGRPSIDGVGFMEDYGYYHTVNVAGAVQITGITPASPSMNGKPTVNGTGAGPSETVSITDGAGGATVGTGTSDASGAWSVTLTTALTAGAHTLVASSLTKGQSAGTPYTVSAAAGPTVLNAYATSLTSVTVTFSAAMKCSSTTGRNDLTNTANYFLNVSPSGALGPTIGSVTASSDCTQATLSLGTALTLGKTYTVIVYFVQDGTNTTVDPANNSASFDIGAPAVSSWSAKQDGTLTLTFSKSMSTAGGTTGGQSVLNYANYLVDSVTAASSTTVSCVVSGTNGCITVRVTFTGGSGSVLGAAGSVHTIGIQNVIDAISGGQYITPNPTNRQMATGS